jgi:Protein of unknown function (DUF1156)
MRESERTYKARLSTEHQLGQLARMLTARRYGAIHFDRLARTCICRRNRIGAPHRQTLGLLAINRESAREKSIRHGHLSTLHLWWARRPLAACRAVLFASIVDDPSSRPDEFPAEEVQERERQRLFRIIEEFVKWDNSNNETVLEQARAEIMRATDGNPRQCSTRSAAVARSRSRRSGSGSKRTRPAYGVDLSFDQLLLVNTAASAFAGLIAVLGGVGAAEASLTPAWVCDGRQRFHRIRDRVHASPVHVLPASDLGVLLDEMARLKGVHLGQAGIDDRSHQADGQVVARSGRKRQGWLLEACEEDRTARTQMLDERLLVRLARNERRPAGQVLGSMQVAARDGREAGVGHPAEQLPLVEELYAVEEAAQPPPVGREVAGRMWDGRRRPEVVGVCDENRGA